MDFKPCVTYAKKALTTLFEKTKQNKKKYMTKESINNKHTMLWLVKIKEPHAAPELQVANCWSRPSEKTTEMWGEKSPSYFFGSLHFWVLKITPFVPGHRDVTKGTD